MMSKSSFTRTLAGLCLAGGLLVPATLAMAKEQPSPEVGAKATQAIQSAFPGAVITSMAKENEDGLDVIGVAFTLNGKKMDGDVTPEGILVGTEEEGDIATFPEPAAAALKKATAGMKVSYEIARTFAKSTKDASGKMTVVKLATPTVAYEADVEKDGKKGEFAFDAQGKMLESPKWAKAGSKEEHEEDDDDKNEKN